MPDRAKVGVRVDAELWNKFREDVEARKGQVRGVLGDELETALRQYLYGPSDAEKKIEDKISRLEHHVDSRLARVEDEVGIATADGGTDTFDAEPHTHAPTQPTVDEKPAANASTDKKVAYLVEQVHEKTSIDADEKGMVPRAVLVETVKDEYGFRSDTAKRYVERLVDHFGLREDPRRDYGQLVTEPKYDAIIRAQREQDAADADNKLDEINNEC